MNKLRYIVLSFIPIILFAMLNIVLSLINYRYPGSSILHIGLISSITIIPAYYICVNWRHRSKPILQYIFMIVLIIIYVLVVGNERLSFYINSDEKMWIGIMKLICIFSMTEVTILWIAAMIIWRNRKYRIALNKYIVLSVIPMLITIISEVVINSFDDDIRLAFMIFGGIICMLVYTTYYYIINYFYRSTNHRYLQMFFSCACSLCCWLICSVPELNLRDINDLMYMVFVDIFCVMAVMIPMVYNYLRKETVEKGRINRLD